MSNFRPLEVVGRASETQLQVAQLWHNIWLNISCSLGIKRWTVNKVQVKSCSANKRHLPTTSRLDYTLYSHNFTWTFVHSAQFSWLHFVLPEPFLNFVREILLWSYFHLFPTSLKILWNFVVYFWSVTMREIILLLFRSNGEMSFWYFLTCQSLKIHNQCWDKEKIRSDKNFTQKC